MYMTSCNLMTTCIATLITITHSPHHSEPSSQLNYPSSSNSFFGRRALISVVQLSVLQHPDTVSVGQELVHRPTIGLAVFLMNISGTKFA